jgi:mono/diheme cytochrome c family protein
MQKTCRWNPGRRTAASALPLLVAIVAALACPPASKAGNQPTARKSTARAVVFTAKATPARLARGRYLVQAVAGCFDCHSDQEYVAGRLRIKPGFQGAGHVWQPGEIPLPPGSMVVSPNITPDKQTGIGSWTDAQVEQAIRHGVANDGRPLFNLMPYWEYTVLSDEDVKSIIVYLRSIPAVRRSLPVTKLPFPVHVDMNEALVPPLPKNASPEVHRGWYLTRAAGCADCHTPILADGSQPPALRFAGGLEFQGPFGTVFTTNITPDPSGISFMNAAMFVRTLRTGRVNGTGLKLSPVMPVKFYRNMTDSDLRAIYAYLRTVKPVRHEIDNVAPPTYCKIDKEKHGLGDKN